MGGVREVEQCAQWCGEARLVTGRGPLCCWLGCLSHNLVSENLLKNAMHRLRHKGAASQWPDMTYSYFSQTKQSSALNRVFRLQ
jgi:hypothetical protein